MTTEKCGETHPFFAEDPEGEIPLTCGRPKGHRGKHQDRRTIKDWVVDNVKHARKKSSR